MWNPGELLREASYKNKETLLVWIPYRVFRCLAMKILARNDGLLNYRLNPPHPRRRSLFFLDFKCPHFRRLFDVWSSTKLLRINHSIIPYHCIYFHDIRIFFPESTEDSTSFCRVFCFFSHGNCDV